jgi:hypothetical protein
MCHQTKFERKVWINWNPMKSEWDQEWEWGTVPILSSSNGCCNVIDWNYLSNHSLFQLLLQWD